MEWSNELTLEFLQLFENEAVIWNPQIPDHKNRNKVADAWNNIKANFSVDCSVVELKKKKDSLMAMFRQLFNKVKASLKSGAGRDEVYKPTWFAYDTMVNFLQPVYSPKDTISTEAQNEEAFDQQDLEQITPPPPTPSPQPPKSKAKRFKSSTQMPPEAIEGHLLQAVNVMQTMTNNKPGRDDCSLYGELLATRLRAMDELNRELLMHAIDDLVFQTTMKIKRGISPSTISSQSSNSNFQQSEWQAHNSQYQQSFVGLNHPQQSHQSLPIRQSLSQMSSASFIGARTSQPLPSQQTPVGWLPYSQHSPSISIPNQLLSPSSSTSSCVPTPQQSPSVPLA